MVQNSFSSCDCTPSKRVRYSSRLSWAYRYQIIFVPNFQVSIFVIHLSPYHYCSKKHFLVNNYLEKQKHYYFTLPTTLHERQAKTQRDLSSTAIYFLLIIKYCFCASNISYYTKRWIRTWMTLSQLLYFKGFQRLFANHFIRSSARSFIHRNIYFSCFVFPSFSFCQNR